MVVVVPTFNEAANIAGMVRRIVALGPEYEALVVDDSSPDGTADAVREVMATEPRVHLMVRTEDRGLGSAVRAGFAEALRLGADFVGQIDADGSHDPAMFPTMLSRIQDGSADVMIGSRYLEGSRIEGWNLHRHANSRVANRLTWWVTRLPVADATNGLRLFRRDVLETVGIDRLKSRGYSIILESNYRAHEAGFRLGEVPVTFHPRLAGESKMGTREVVRFVAFLLSLRAASLRGALALLASLALFGLMLGQVWRTLHDERVPYETTGSLFYNGDIMFPPSFYKDVVEDGYRAGTFRPPPAPFWFPDVVLYFPIRAVIGATAPAVFAWVAAMFLLHVGTAACVGRAVAGTGRRYVVPLVLAFAAGYLYWNARTFFTHHDYRNFYLPVYHPGAVVCAYLALPPALWFMRSGRGWKAGLVPLAVTTLVATAAVLSDRLFAAWYVAPMVAGLGFVRLFGRGDDPQWNWNWRKLFALTAALGAATVVGLVLLKWVTPIGDPIGHYWYRASFAEVVSDMWAFKDAVWKGIAARNRVLALAAVWYGWSAVSLAVAAVRRAFGGRPADRSFLFYQAFSLVAAVLTVGLFVVSARGHELVRTPWAGYDRYFVGPLSFAFFGWAFALARLAASASAGVVVRNVACWAPLALVAAGVVTLANRPVLAEHVTRELPDYYPDFVGGIDAACRKHGMKYGLSGYWVAKPTTVLSREGAVVRHVVRQPLSPFGFIGDHWISNSEWYWRKPGGGGVPKYEFVVAAHAVPWNDAIPLVQEVVDALGEPAAREPAGPFTVLVYNRPTDALARFADLDVRALGLRFEANGEPTVRIPGGAFCAPSWVDRSPKWEALTAEEGRTECGTAMGGHLMGPLRPGRYRVTFHTSSVGTDRPNGRAMIVYNDSVYHTHTPIAEADVLATADGVTTLPLYIPAAAKWPELEFRVEYTGPGTLVLHDVEVERVSNRRGK